MTPEEIKPALEAHGKWICGEKGGARANLSRANLSRANLSRADLTGADLYGAILSKANLPAFQIPQEGELIVWKAVNGGVAKLRIPPEAGRTASLVGRKCRAEWVEVLSTPCDKEASGLRDHSTKYVVGEITRPDKYDPDPRVEYTHGIHFFLTREEAEACR